MGYADGKITPLNQRLTLAIFALATMAFCPPPKEIGLPKPAYESMFEDDIITNAERRLLFENYYTELPAKFMASATLYGRDADSRAELLSYGGWMRQQMERGWVLIASGDYGYHPELSSYTDDILLSKQASPLYSYFADRYKDSRNQPIPISYEQLNDRQKRIYAITSVDIRESANAALFFTTIADQSRRTPQEALAEAKYIAIVSAKSVNDFGRRFLLYKDGAFVGVVLVGGEAKRDDWTGLGSPTSDYFSFDSFPLIIRESNNQHWAFDLPTSVYKYYGGSGGPVSGIYAVDPDAQVCSRKR